MNEKFKHFDFTLMISPILLAAFGLLMVYSSSMVTAIVEGHSSTFYLAKQFQWFVIGIIAMIFSSFFPYRKYQKYIKLIMISVILLLLAVLVFGEVRNNAKSWFAIGPISVQPAEFAKIGLIMYLASIYSKKQAYIENFLTAVFPPLLFTAFILGLIVLQPDIGTAFIILMIACSVIFSSGIRMKHLLVLLLTAVIFLAIAVPAMVTEVRISRFTGAYKPFEAPDSAGYHLIQSYLAIANGGLTGEGLGQSVQKLGYLMEAHTDFIMAIITEELGLFGVLIVVGLLAIIVLRGLHISRKCKDSFGSLLAIGITSMIAIQAMINLGAISGILPITGVPLPFVSYGGSSLLVLMFSIGVLNNIAKTVRQKESKPMKLDVIKQNPVRNVLHNRGGKSWLN